MRRRPRPTSLAQVKTIAGGNCKAGKRRAYGIEAMKEMLGGGEVAQDVSVGVLDGRQQEGSSNAEGIREDQLAVIR